MDGLERINGVIFGSPFLASVVNFLSYRPALKIYYFVPAKIPAVPELFQSYRSKFRISAGNLILGRNQNL